MEHLQRKVFKISTTRFRNANWKLQVSYEKAVQLDEVIFLFDSQMFRLIEQIRGGSIDSLKEVLSVKIDNKKDFNRVTNSKGIELNGIIYKRFVGTTGGLKNKTLIFVNAEIIDELNRRCECKRNEEVKLVPAKYEAYKALTASASTQIVGPKNILVVDDVITKYKGDVISLDDSNTDEPVMEKLYNYDLENNATDGFNLCTFEYMQKVADSLNLDYVPSGVCLRNAWLKGMLFPFPIMEFVKQFGTGYIVKDIWGHDIDIRTVDMILTESSLKLWKCYNSAEEYLSFTREMGYEFSVTKISPKVLEDVRALNYQYLQSYELSNEDIEKLCEQTKEWIEGSLCGDYESTLRFLGISDRIQKKDWTYALYKDKRFLHDEYIISKIRKLIYKKINDSKIGKLVCNGNYQILSGDPVILMQHILGIKETGILKPGEVYSKYWLDKDVRKVVAFRSPMTSHENIRKVIIHDSSEARYWYQYMQNICIVNSWDTFCMATNGSDFDSDSIYTTNNTVLVDSHRELPAIMCVQQSAEKKKITEKEIIKSNWAGMGITVGAITNRVTSQIDVQAAFEIGSKEYEELSYRIISGQLYQQASIDSVKGIKAKPMPSYWYSLRNCNTEFDKSICAQYKPYFMIYRYDKVRKDYKDYIVKSNVNALKRFGKTLEELLESDSLTDSEVEFIIYYNKYMPVCVQPSTMNRICWYMESVANNYKMQLNERKLSYDFLKYHCICHNETKENVERLFQFYLDKLNLYRKDKRGENADLIKEKLIFNQYIREQLKSIYKQNEVFNILIDIANRSSMGKQFMWEVYCPELLDRIEEIEEGRNHVNYE